MCTHLIKISSKEGILSVPCGQCRPCRINKGRKWTCRLLMEQLCHPISSFVTLSYAPEHLPPGDNLIKSDLQKYIKRLRNAGLKFRYFAVGEYGDQSGRSHYHLAIFGSDMYSIFGTTKIKPLSNGHATHADKHWKKGRVHIATLNENTAAYICGYTSKKLTTKHNIVINGRNPEFTLQSRKPPLGTAFITHACKQLTQAYATRDTPAQDAIRQFEEGRIRINSRIWPLDAQMLKTVYRILGPSDDGPNQKITRAQLRETIGNWTGTNMRNAKNAASVAAKSERLATVRSLGRTF